MSPSRKTLDLETIVVVGENQVSAELTAGIAGELVILDLNAGVYYELNDVGAFVWRAIHEPRSVGSVLGNLQTVYDVPEEDCEADLFALLERLLEKELIDVRDA